MNTDFTKLFETLSFLVGPVGIGAWALFASDLFRGWDGTGKFKDYSPLGKSLANLGLLVSAPVLAFVVLSVVPKDVLESLQPYYGFVATLFTAFITQQGYFWIKSNQPKDKPADTVEGVLAKAVDASLKADPVAKEAAVAAAVENATVPTADGPAG